MVIEGPLTSQCAFCRFERPYSSWDSDDSDVMSGPFLWDWFSHWFNQPTISNSHVIKKNSGKLGAPLYKLGIDMCFMLNTKQCAADWGLFKTEGLHRFFCQRKRFPKRRLSSIILQCFKSHSLWACLIHLRQAWKRKSPCSFSSIARAHLQIFDWSQVSQVPCSCFFQVADYQRF